MSQGMGSLRQNLWLAFFFVFPLSVFASDSWESIGVSTQSLGRGGADVAVGDSALSQVANPATLALSPRHTRLFDFGAQFLFPSITWSTPLDTSTSDGAGFFPNMAVTNPINDRLTVGAAYYSKNGAFVDFDMRHLLIPFRKTHIHEDFGDTAFLFNAAYKLTDKLSVGMGVRGELLTGKFNAVFGAANEQMHRVWAAGGGLQFGLHYQATRKLSLGLSYYTPSWMTHIKNGDYVMEFFDIIPVPFGKANASEWRIPQKIALGSAYDLTPWWKLIGEARWINFRNSVCNAVTVDTNGLLDFPFALKFSDQWVFIAGSEFKLSDRWKLDVGYNYGSNPLSSHRLFPLAPPAIVHHLTLGLRYETPRWWVGGGYIYGFKNSQSAPGTSHIPLAPDFGVSSFSHWEQEIFMGFGFHW